MSHSTHVGFSAPPTVACNRGPVAPSVIARLLSGPPVLALGVGHFCLQRCRKPSAISTSSCSIFPPLQFRRLPGFAATTPWVRGSWRRPHPNEARQRVRTAAVRPRLLRVLRSRRRNHLRVPRQSVSRALCVEIATLSCIVVPRRRNRSLATLPDTTTVLDDAERQLRPRIARTIPHRTRARPSLRVQRQGPVQR